MFKTCVDQLGPNAYELSGNLFQQMSHVLSLCLAGRQLYTVRALRATCTYMHHLQSLTVMHHAHASSPLQAISTGHTASSTQAYCHRLGIEALPSLVELVDASEHTDFLTSVRRLQVTKALRRSELQHTLTIVHDVLPMLHHFDFKLLCELDRNGLETTDGIGINDISFVKSLVIRGITTGEVLPWIEQAFPRARVANLQHLNLYLTIRSWSQGYVQALEQLSKLDHIISGKRFALLRTLTLSVLYLFMPGEEPTGDEDRIRQALPLCCQRRVLNINMSCKNLFETSWEEREG
jgi:hypothetical protein